MIECYLRPLVSSPLRKAQFHAYCVALEPNPLLGIEPALQRCPVPLRDFAHGADAVEARHSYCARGA